MIKKKIVAVTPRVMFTVCSAEVGGGTWGDDENMVKREFDSIASLEQFLTDQLNALVEESGDGHEDMLTVLSERHMVFHGQLREIATNDIVVSSPTVRLRE